MVHSVLTNAPVWVVYVLFALVPAALAVAAHDRFRRIVPGEVLIPHHEVAGFLVSVVGLLFAVVLAFLVAAAWANFDAAQRNADAEASDVAEAFATSQILPQPTRGRVRSLLADYAFEVRDREWPLLAKGEQDPQARRLMLRSFSEVALMPVMPNATISAALQRSSLQTIVLSSLHDLSEKRRSRLLDAGRHIEGALYLALVLAWVILLAFVFLFGCARVLQLSMTALITAMIGLLFAVIVEFDLPYGHGIRVSTAAWTFVIENNRLADYRTATPAR
jgi:amino acid transporter